MESKTRAENKVRMNAWNQKLLPTPQYNGIEELDHVVGGIQTEIVELRMREIKVDELRRNTSTGMARLRQDMLETVRTHFSSLTDDHHTLLDIVVQLREEVAELSEEIVELKKLVDDQREMMEVMWNAPGMPGGQEAIQKAKESVAAFFVGGTHLHNRQNGGLGIN